MIFFIFIAFFPCKYFNKYGWIFDKERRIENKINYYKNVSEENNENINDC